VSGAVGGIGQLPSKDPARERNRGMVRCLVVRIGGPGIFYAAVSVASHSIKDRKTDGCTFGIIVDSNIRRPSARKDVLASPRFSLQ
jgi:hypothetical protein